MIVSGHDGRGDHAVRMVGMARAMIDVVSHMTGFDGRPLQVGRLLYLLLSHVILCLYLYVLCIL